MTAPHRRLPNSHLLSAEAVSPAPARDRSQIPARHTWDLTDLYPSDQAWKQEKERVAAEISGLSRFQGQLGASASALVSCLELSSQLARELGRLHAYASMCSDQDTRNTTYLGMVQEITQVLSSYAAAAAYIEPEILAMDRARIDQLLASEPGLAVYRHYLDDVLRRKAHTGTEREETLIAEAGLMADGPRSIYSVFSYAEFPFPQVTFADGTDARLDHSAFALHRARPHRGDREQVFAAFFGALHDYRRTFAAQLHAEVKKNMFYTRARRYGSCLESALHADNIPVEVYETLIERVNASLGTFHRYLALRKRILGVDQLHYHDLYAPLLGNVELSYSVDQARDHILAAVAPLGDDYAAVIRRAFDERWIDMFPTEGKRSGAYASGSAYDVHPYMLMNYNGKYDDVSTLAHELGHAMHSYLSNRAQPFPTAGYAIFVAEVASTFNEALLLRHMLEVVSDDAVRLSILGSYLEGIKGTVFRQTQFAELELRIHQTAERGEPLTGDSLSELYLGITRTYYGHDAGVCVVGDEIQAEWAYIPHFYYNFYVYQYATAFTASAALSEQVLAGDADARARYLAFLSSGGSNYPIHLLRNAGVDMTSSLPFDLTMQQMNRVMDEMEAILARLPA